MKAIAAVIVLVGAFNVYFKMQSGDQDVKKTIMLPIGGCVAFIICLRHFRCSLGKELRKECRTFREKSSCKSMYFLL